MRIASIRSCRLWLTVPVKVTSLPWKMFGSTEILVPRTASESTGNMGIIDIARKSGSRLEYEFEPVDDQYSYYMLTVKVQENPD